MHALSKADRKFLENLERWGGERTVAGIVECRQVLRLRDAGYLVITDPGTISPEGGIGKVTTKPNSGK